MSHQKLAIDRSVGLQPWRVCKNLDLVRNRDGHHLATISSHLLSLLEGKTDCPISGVFGAGKTKAAAATVAGLITVDPNLKIMMLTKENVTAQAFAEHFLRLGLPAHVNRKVGLGILLPNPRKQKNRGEY